MIDICFVTDENYAPYMCAVIVSVLNNSKNNIHFHVFDNGISEKTKKTIHKLVDEPNKLSFIDCKKISEKFKNIKQCVAHITKTSYIKFVIADILKDLDKIIYLDCDLIVESDFNDLWNLNLKDNLIAAVEDVGYTYWCKHNSELKLKFKCMNSGVMLINCKQWRAEDLSQKLIDCAKKHDKVGFGQDQPVLNYICRDRILFIPFKWNVQDTFFRNEIEIINRVDYSECLNAINNPCVIHYTYVRKPWNDIGVVKAQNFWKYYGKTKFGKQQLLKRWLNKYLFNFETNDKFINIRLFLFKIHIRRKLCK